MVKTGRLSTKSQVWVSSFPHYTPEVLFPWEPRYNQAHLRMTTLEISTRVNYGDHHNICSRLTSCRQIEGQEIARMQQSMTKSQPDLVSTMMNVFNRFQINPLSCCLEMCGHHESVTDGRNEWTGQVHSYANAIYDIKYICHHWDRLWLVTQWP